MGIYGYLALLCAVFGVLGVVSAWVNRVSRAIEDGAGAIAGAMARHTSMLGEQFRRLEEQHRKVEHAQAMRPRVLNDDNIDPRAAELLRRL